MMPFHDVCTSTRFFFSSEIVFVADQEEIPVRKVAATAFLAPQGSGGAASAASHEGIVPWLYLDNLGLVTTATGNLVEDTRDGSLTGDKPPKPTFQTFGTPLSNVFTMGWKNPDGSLASPQQITDAWNAVKAAQHLVSGAHPQSGATRDMAALTAIRLGPADAQVNQITPEIMTIVQKEIDRIENALVPQVSGYDAWPADAQLALVHWAWAKGPSFNGWPLLHAALRAVPPDFHAAAVQSHISNGTPALNALIAQMYENAARVLETNADPDVVYYPGTVGGASPLLANFGGARAPMTTTKKIILGLGVLATAGAAYAYLGASK